MADFEDILKSAQWHQNIQKSLGLSTQLSELMEAQASFTKSLGGVRMISEIAKSMQLRHKMFENPTLSAIEAMTKGLSLQVKFAIPQTTLDAISSINRQHEQLFGNLRSITEALNKKQAAFNQISSWQFAISGMSGQLAVIAASQKKWNLIDNFEEITEDAVSLNKRIFDENGVTKEGLDELKAFFQRIEIKVDKIDADANSLFWKLLVLVSFFLTVMGEARNLLPKPEYATKQEVETVIKEQFGIYEKKLKEDKEFRITSKDCKVMSKSRLKSLVIEKLPTDFDVTVLQVNHKWVYVTYLSPIDNLPQTGWIMKKYLDKPE
jgi:hypothetical protein